MQLLRPCSNSNDGSSNGLRAALAAALRPSLLFVFAEPGLPLQPLLRRLCCCFGLALIDMDEEAAAAAAPAAVAKHRRAVEEPPATVMCPALLDRVEALQRQGRLLIPKT